jgi:hypothetical protein
MLDDAGMRKTKTLGLFPDRQTVGEVVLGRLLVRADIGKKLHAEFHSSSHGFHWRHNHSDSARTVESLSKTGRLVPALSALRAIGYLPATIGQGRKRCG